MMSGTPSSRGGQVADAVEAVGFVCLTCLCVTAGFALALNSAGASASRDPFRIDDTVNPNDASVASLARLPNIGPSRARQIVSYRSELNGPGGRAPAFRHAEDLREITGIGPTTIEAVRPWLSFDLSPSGRRGSVSPEP